MGISAIGENVLRWLILIFRSVRQWDSVMWLSWRSAHPCGKAPGCLTQSMQARTVVQKHQPSCQIDVLLFNPMRELWQPPGNAKPFLHALEVDNTETDIAEGQVSDNWKELPYLENELWHKIFAATDLETCRANRIAFHDMLSRDWDAAWTFLFSDSEKDQSRPLKPPQDWPMMILLLRKRKIPDVVRSRICERFARYKNPSLLKEARQAGCCWSGLVIVNAICFGSVECLRWARENGCKRYLYEEFVAETAAFNGFLDVLKYLHQNGFFWDGYTMQNALRGGHLDCLKFANENDCPWGDMLSKAANRYQTDLWTKNHWDCVQYLIDAGCPRAELAGWSVPKQWWGSVLNLDWNAQHKLM